MNIWEFSKEALLISKEKRLIKAAVLHLQRNHWKTKVSFWHFYFHSGKRKNLKIGRGFIKGRAPGKLTSCEHDFARLLYISKNFFLIQGMIKNSLSYNRALSWWVLSSVKHTLLCNFHFITRDMKSPRLLCVKNKNRPITHCEKNCAS